MSEGFTISHRKKWRNPVFRNLLEAGIWSWMCDTAVWKDSKIRFNGILIDLERGQLATSVRFISKGFGIGDQVTRTFLENLEKEQMINTLPTHWGTIVTICNYDKYQCFENAANTPGNERVTHGQHTGNTNKKEINNINNKTKDISPGFAGFWASFPKDRAGSKEKAKQAYVKALTRATEKEIMDGVEAYRTSSEVTRGFAKGAAAWLNDDRWTSKYAPDPEAKKAVTKQRDQTEAMKILRGEV